MNILLITDEVWNDSINGNNIMSNWFLEFPAEIANIYCSPGIPQNNCCSKYFQLTDISMLKSIITKTTCGRTFEIKRESDAVLIGDEAEKVPGYYTGVKKITTETIRYLREFVWLHGKYNISLLRQFINDFKPDIIFTTRVATRKIMRLERIVQEISGTPMVAFTGDDEYSLQQVRFSPIYWIRRVQTRRMLRENVQLYSMYYCHSIEQAKEYKKIFGIETKRLLKCSRNHVQKKENVNTPIKIVYAGKLYCGRWKTLAYIKDAINKLNFENNSCVFRLDIYTNTPITAKISDALCESEFCRVHDAVSAEQLKQIYQYSDIALHVEAFDRKNKQLVRFSFSTKIVDCLESGCMVIAVCPSDQSGLRFLRVEDAALCIDKPFAIEDELRKIADTPQLINYYQTQAMECIKKELVYTKVQNELYNDLKKIIRGENPNAHNAN